MGKNRILWEHPARTPDWAWSEGRRELPILRVFVTVEAAGRRVEDRVGFSGVQIQDACARTLARVRILQESLSSIWLNRHRENPMYSLVSPVLGLSVPTAGPGFLQLSYTFLAETSPQLQDTLLRL